MQTDATRTDAETRTDTEGSDSARTAGADTGEPARETMSGSEPAAELTDRIEQGLERLREEFLQLELDQMRKGEIEARAKLANAKKAVGEKRAEVADRLDTVRKASGAVLEEARVGLQAAWKELRDAVERARDDFEGRLAEEEEEDEDERA